MIAHLVGTGATASVSVGIGWLRNLNHRMKRQAKALQREQKLLQVEIARRIQAENALRQANTELQTRNKELDAFAHTVAHDLKNPLSIITSYGEILSRVGLTMSPKELELIFGEVQKSARKATNIIEELLLLASSRKEAVTIRSLNMEAIVAAAQARLTLMIQESQAETLYPQHWPRSLGYGPWVEEVWVNYLNEPTTKYPAQ